MKQCSLSIDKSIHVSQVHAHTNTGTNKLAAGMRPLAHALLLPALASSATDVIHRRSSSVTTSMELLLMTLLVLSKPRKHICTAKQTSRQAGSSARLAS